MRAYLLSGGRGSRLRPRIGDLPKALAPFRGRPFLEVQLEWLAALGVREVVLSLGVGAEQVIAHLERAGRLAGLALSWAVESEPLGTAGGLRFAAAGERERFLAVNGDTLAEVDAAALVGVHEERGARLTLAAYRVPDARARGIVELDEDGRVRAFREKAGGGPAWVSGGIYLCEPAALARVPDGRASSLEQDLFPELVAAGEPLWAWRAPGRFYDIGTPEGIDRAEREWGTPAPEATS